MVNRSGLMLFGIGLATGIVGTALAMRWAGRAPANRGSNLEFPGESSRGSSLYAHGEDQGRFGEAVPSPRRPERNVSSSGPAPRESATDLQQQLRRAVDARHGRKTVALLREFLNAGSDGHDRALEALLDIARSADSYKIHPLGSYNILNEPAGLAVLQKALERPGLDPKLRDYLLWALSHSDTAETEAFLLNKAAAERDPETLGRYLAALEGRDSPAVRETLTRFAQAVEQPPPVRLAAVGALGCQDDAGVRDALGRLVQSPAEPSAIRVASVIALARQSDRSIDSMLSTTARLDADSAVREAATVALLQRNPPVEGILVHGIAPNTQAQAQGLRPGDIILEYNGRRCSGDGKLAEALQAVAAEQSAPMLVYRHGQTVQLAMRGGFLGIGGMYVAPPQ